LDYLLRFFLSHISRTGFNIKDLNKYWMIVALGTVINIGIFVFFSKHLEVYVADTIASAGTIVPQ
jgi:putative flippase GtrA